MLANYVVYWMRGKRREEWKVGRSLYRGSPRASLPSLRSVVYEIFNLDTSPPPCSTVSYIRVSLIVHKINLELFFSSTCYFFPLQVGTTI